MSTPRISEMERDAVPIHVLLDNHQRPRYPGAEVNYRSDSIIDNFVPTIGFERNAIPSIALSYSQRYIIIDIPDMCLNNGQLYTEHYTHPNPKLMECHICCEPRGICIAYDVDLKIQPGIICEKCYNSCDMIHPTTRVKITSCASPFTHHPSYFYDAYHGDKCNIADPELFLARMIVKHEYEACKLLEYSTYGVE